MEYFIGSVVTIVLMILLNIFTKNLPVNEQITIQTSQSYIFDLVGRNIMLENIKKVRPSQASKYSESLFVKILMVKGKAYWIKDNVFYVADVVENEVDKSTAREVDTMSMNKVQLEEIMFIIDKLKEDSYNDNWDSR